ncbi:MAG: 16S rRNA (guanine(527)-N(7))-methyltransferase RsmG [Nitrospirota bacterium]|nr:16S rRNA (guanine(527)-N(7))-methyltransferase RsmG [Nitrospirota bacterium]
MDTDYGLRAACGALGVAPMEAQVAGLLRYTEELLRWGARINLTGARTPEEFVRGQLVDAVSLLPELSKLPSLPLSGGGSWADVGSGAGLPGIPLAILTPGVTWHLVEPREKRWAFLVHVRHHLKLGNVQIHRARIEDAPLAEGILDGVISRALGFDALAAYPWLRPGGVMAVVTGESLDPWGRAAKGLPLTPREPVALVRGGAVTGYLLTWTRADPEQGDG